MKIINAEILLDNSDRLDGVEIICSKITCSFAFRDKGYERPKELTIMADYSDYTLEFQKVFHGSTMLNCIVNSPDAKLNKRG